MSALKQECATSQEDEGDEPATDAGSATPTTMAGEEEKKQKPRRPENRMSMREIRSILNPKPPTQWPSPYHELRESNPSLIPLAGEEMDDERRKLYARAKEFRRMEEEDVKLQVWVRNEMETKGYVEMDEDWVRRRAEVSAMIEETMKKAHALLINDTEEEDSDDESDSDDDEDDEFYF